MGSLSELRHTALGRLVLVSLLALVPSLQICHSLFWPVDGWFDRHGFVLGRDFVNFWAAGRLAAEGRLAELYDLDAYHAALQALLGHTHRFMNFSYMPNALPLVRPLGALPHGVALVIWECASLLAFAVAATGKLVPERRELRLLVLISPVVLLVLSLAQATFLLALLFVGAFRLLPRRPIAAGILFGLLTIKPQLGLLIPLLLLIERRWLTIASAAATAALLAAVSVALYGLEPWQAYLANTVPYQARVLAEPFGLVWAMMITPYAFLCQIGLAPPVAMKLHTALALVVGAAALWSIRGKADGSLAATVIALAAVLITPYSLAYDLAIPAAALLWHLSERTRALSPVAEGALAPFWALPLILIPLNIIGAPVMPPVIAVLFALIVAEARFGESAGAPELAAQH